MKKTQSLSANNLMPMNKIKKKINLIIKSSKKSQPRLTQLTRDPVYKIDITPHKNSETNLKIQGPISYYRTIKLKKQSIFKKNFKKIPNLNRTNLQNQCNEL